jgi:hypothetical protein
MRSGRTRLPAARTDDLVVQKLVDETLAYDLKRHRAHVLNPVAALVWRYCDGTTSLGDVSRIIEAELRISADPELVCFVLERLRKAHLLEDDKNRAANDNAYPYTRRDFVKKLNKLGLAASLMLPLITSIVSPTPAYAQTCVPNTDCSGKANCTPCDNPGGQCQGTWRCCNNQCVPIGLARAQCGC